MDNSLNSYNTEKIVEIVYAAIDNKYGTANKIKEAFRSNLKAKIKSVYKPKVITDNELEIALDKLSAVILQHAQQNLTPRNIGVLLSEDFKNKCRQGVVMKDELNYIFSVAKQYMEQMISHNHKVVMKKKRELKAKRR